MTALIARVDAWCRRGDFTIEDIARYRIIYGTAILLALPSFGHIAGLPPTRFDPPLGPIMVFSSLPPRVFLEALELVVAVSAAFLVLGIRTRVASLVLALALMTGFGLTYSFGKIDHLIVMVLVPAVLAFSSWGGALSIDPAMRSRSATPPAVAQWPMRLLGFMIGLAFLTAGWAKLRGGWLDLDTQAAHGHFVHGYVIHDRTGGLATRLLEINQHPVIWEAVDWFTVAMEIGLVFAVLSWRLFRVAAAVVTLFHLGVFLAMNLQFSVNVIGYGAFYRWNSFAPTRERSRFGPMVGRRAAHGLAMLLGVVVYVVQNELGADMSRPGTWMLFVGSALAALYLGKQLVDLMLRRRNRTAVAADR